jgi:hypothetical protein
MISFSGQPLTCTRWSGDALLSAPEVFAVGTLVSERPPHRSERAQFGHSAPTSGV